MRITKDWARGAALVAGLNLAIPQAVVFAADAPVTRPATPKIKDIRLTTGGGLAGRVVTAEGKAVDGAAVTISQNGKPVAQVVSTETGEFTAAGMKTGVYQVSAGRSVEYVRAWPQDVAPPNSIAQTTLVQGPIVRGQDEFDYLETDEIIIGAVAGAALGIGIAALVIANDNKSSNNNVTASP